MLWSKTNISLRGGTDYFFNMPLRSSGTQGLVLFGNINVYYLKLWKPRSLVQRSDQQLKTHYAHLYGLQKIVSKTESSNEAVI